MMLTTKGRYAVMAMVDLSYYNGVDKVIALHEISSRQNISVSYLEQLFAKLKMRHLVKSIKGPGGGYMLNKPAKDITILEIISVVDESIKITRCENMGKGCIAKDSKICFTHALWDGLGKQISSYLGNITLQDICNNIVSEKNHAK